MEIRYEIDFDKWALELVKKGQLAWHYGGWSSVAHLLSSSLREAYDKGVYDNWEGASVQDVEEFLNDEDKKATEG